MKISHPVAIKAFFRLLRETPRNGETLRLSTVADVSGSPAEQVGQRYSASRTPAEVESFLDRLADERLKVAQAAAIEAAEKAASTLTV